MIRKLAVVSRLRDLPIRRKLRLISGLTTAVALTLAGLGVLAADSFLSFRYLRNDLATFVQVIGDNSTGSLAFDDPKAAAESLGALRARSHVQIACLLQNSGALLASYIRPGFKGNCPSPGPQPVRTQGGLLIATQPVQLDGRRLGTLVLQSDLGEVYDRVSLYGAIVLAGLFISFVITFTLSSRLRALISGPILELAGLAHSITRTGDYSARAPKGPGDEVGVLSDALNQMMDTVQFREGELRKALEYQKTANRQMTELNTELQRSNNDLERFAFMVSHDLQEPLRMITAYSQMLVAKYDSADKAQLDIFASYVAGGTTRMRELLADVLTYSEIAGSTDRPTEPVDLNAVIADVLDLMRVRLDQLEARVLVDPMPILYAHPSRITSLFQNLIDNAIKYRSEAPPEVRIRVEQDSSEFRFAVADNGIGIAKEYQSKVFVAFQRLHGREIPGTGIGLAICKRVVERYGGSIWVESETGSGSIIRFTLPRSLPQKME